jgi:hypothetical protein
MISNALQMLQSQAQRATQTLTEARTQITDSFSQDYVIGAHQMEKLISAQHSVHYWTQITRIMERAENEAGSVQGLREWATRTADRLLEGGRGMSTSMISNAITLSEEDEQKRVLQQVLQFVSYIDNHS